MDEITLQDLLLLDKSDGYSIQLVIWPNDPEYGTRAVWSADHMIHPEDFRDSRTRHQTLVRLCRFLDQYKKTPIAYTAATGMPVNANKTQRHNNAAVDSGGKITKKRHHHGK
jgi:hypothetical protein